MTSIERTRWPIVVLAFAAGIAAAMQVGKVPPALPSIRGELGLSLVATGWVASLFNAIGATAGALTGLVADRLGRRRAVLLGLSFLSMGSALGGVADGTAALLAARFLEGVGFVSVAVAAAALLAEVTRPADLRLVVGCWAIYLPGGMGLMMLLSPLMLERGGWRALWLGNAALLLVLLLVVAIATRGVGAPPAEPRRMAAFGAVLRRPGPWLLAAIFGCYTLQWFAVMTWLPSYATERLGLGAPAAALASAMVVLINVLGCVGGGVLLYRGMPRWRLIVAALVTMGLCAVGFFSAGVPDAFRYALVLAFSGIGGLLPSAALAAAPVHAPTPGDVGAVNGMINQGSNLGTLSGPPLTAALISWGGSWDAAAPLLPVLAAIGIALALVLRTIERRTQA